MSFDLRKASVALAVFALVVLASGIVASADSVTVTDGIDFNHQATINIVSLTSGSITFTVTNILVPDPTSSITALGFELPGTITANSPGVCSGDCGNFGAAPLVSNSPGAVPAFPGAVLDWALLTGTTFANENPPGIDEGDTGTFTVTGNFTGLTQAQFLAGVFVKFHEPVSGPVPEPGTALLLATGLIGLAAGVRARLKIK